jgi:hypothetical protein
MVPPRLRRAATATAFVVCVALNASPFRSVIVAEQLAEGEIRRGYFEEVDGAIGLVTTEYASDLILPETSQARAGILSVPPGNTAVLSLVDGSAYTVSSQTSLPPYVVLGWVDGASRADRSAAPLVNGGRFVEHELQLDLVPWDASRPWHEDAAWLRTLGERCGDLAMAPTLSIRPVDDGLDVHLGRCAGRVRATGASGGNLSLAVLAGPDWDRVQRDGRPFRATRWVRGYALIVVVLICLLDVALLMLGMGLLGMLSATLPMAFASIWAPGPAILLVLVQLLLGIASSAWWLAGRVTRGRRLPIRLGAWVAVVASGVGAITGLLRSAEHVREPSAANSRCVLTGYSAAAGRVLREDGAGTGPSLDRLCDACAGMTAVRARTGATFGFVRDLACSQPRLLPPGGRVAFLGGANDDLLFSFDKNGPLLSVVYRLFGFAFARSLYDAEPSLKDFEDLTKNAAARSLAAMDVQSNLMDETVRCVASDNGTFVFAHDFLVLDLPGGRDAARREMLERRRRTVLAAGGEFVDLLELFERDVGVSWFNDYVHPSAVAHRRIALAICQRFPTQKAP